MTDQEVWTDVAGYRGLYEISNMGRVRTSLARFSGGFSKKLDEPRILSQRLSADGYPRCALSNKKSRSFRVHRLVYMSFVGPIPDKMNIAHLNGNRKDARLENLACVTAKENHSHKQIHGTQQRGERCHSARLTADDVVKIRREHKAGTTAKAIAIRYGLHPSTIEKVVNLKTWRHVTEARSEAKP